MFVSFRVRHHHAALVLALSDDEHTCDDDFYVLVLVTALVNGRGTGNSAQMSVGGVGVRKDALEAVCGYGDGTGVDDYFIVVLYTRGITCSTSSVR